MWSLILLLVSDIVAVGAHIDQNGACPESCFCNKQLTSVYCNGKRLQTVPTGIPNSVKRLYLSYNFFNFIGPQNFTGLNQLEKLWLDHNKISVIAPFAFSPLTHVEYIDMRNNYISAIGSNAFAEISSLEELYLTTNKIKSIHPDAFNGSSSITSIHLGANKLTQIPPIRGMRNLKTLVMEGNDIFDATFPSEYSVSSLLSEIILSNNQVKHLKTGTFSSLKNCSITKLEISRNGIVSIKDDVFSPLSSLTSLRIGNNPLTGASLEEGLSSLKGKNLISLNIANLSLGGDLPYSTFSLLQNSTIRDISMENNAIINIPDKAFFALKNLLFLDLSGCKIQTINTTAFEGLERLSRLFLNDNKLVDVPKNLPPTLTVLYLNGNQIADLHDRAFEQLYSLQVLYLGGNLIQAYHEDTFLNLRSLIRLHLESNKLSNDIPAKGFAPLVRLISLDMSRNLIKSIPNSPDILKSLAALDYLNLAGNSLGTLPLELLNHLGSLRYLHLEDNELGKLIAVDHAGQLFQGLTNLRELYLQNNKITNLPDTTFHQLGSLTNLSLARNQIPGWGNNLFKSTQKLKYLDLSLNLVATVKEENLKDLGGLKVLNLTGDPFNCNCDLRWFRDWINKTQTVLPKLQTYKCNDPKDWKGKFLLSFDRTKINCTFFTTTTLIITGVAVGVAVLFLVVLLVVASYRNRWRIRLRMYRATRRMKLWFTQNRPYKGYEEVPGEAKEHDAYISYHEEDLHWVLQYLMPGIDNGNDPSPEQRPYGGDFKLYLDERDSTPGHTHFGNIVENMESSKKVLIVLTEKYVGSGQKMWELEYAMNLKVERKLDEAIVLKVAGVPAKRIPKLLFKVMKERTFIEWELDQNALENFKETLKDRLMRKDIGESLDV